MAKIPKLIMDSDGTVSLINCEPESELEFDKSFDEEYRAIQAKYPIKDSDDAKLKFEHSLKIAEELKKVFEKFSKERLNISEVEITLFIKGDQIQKVKPKSYEKGGTVGEHLVFAMVEASKIPFHDGISYKWTNRELEFEKWMGQTTETLEIYHALLGSHLYGNSQDPQDSIWCDQYPAMMMEYLATLYEFDSSVALNKKPTKLKSAKLQPDSLKKSGDFVLPSFASNQNSSALSSTFNLPQIAPANKMTLAEIWDSALLPSFYNDLINNNPTKLYYDAPESDELISMGPISTISISAEPIPAEPQSHAKVSAAPMPAVPNSNQSSLYSGNMFNLFEPVISLDCEAGSENLWESTEVPLTSLSSNASVNTQASASSTASANASVKPNSTATATKNSTETAANIPKLNEKNVNNSEWQAYIQENSHKKLLLEIKKLAMANKLGELSKKIAEFKNSGGNINDYCDNWGTVLHYAAKAERIDAVVRLVVDGAADMQAPLHKSVKRSKTPEKILLENGKLDEFNRKLEAYVMLIIESQTTVAVNQPGGNSNKPN